MAHDDAACVAGEPPGRFRGNVLAVFEGRLAGLIRVHEHWRVDVDDNLVAVTRRTGVEIVVQRGFRDHGQRVGLLLTEAWRIAFGVIPPGPCVHPVPSGVQRPPQVTAPASGVRRPRTTTMPSAS